MTLGSRTVQMPLSRPTTSAPTRLLYFDYIVKATDKDTDGITVAADALTLNGGTIRSQGGTNAALSLGSHAFTNNAS